MADPILPRDLDAAPSVPSNASIIIDNGVTVQKATPAQVADTARPFSNQAEAEAGTDNAKTMTPLRTAQAIDARGYDGLIDGKEPLVDAGTTGQYYRGDKSWQALNKAAVGLGSADDTADADKPVSAAQQAALDDKTTAAAIGISGTATDMGPGGEILTDNADARTWFAELEDAILDTPGTALVKANATAIGVAPTDANMGTTPGTILSDNGTVKDWFQESEAAIEARPTSDTLAAATGGEAIGLPSGGTVGKAFKLKDGNYYSACPPTFNNAATPAAIKLIPKPASAWDKGIFQGFTFVPETLKFYTTWDIIGGGSVSVMRQSAAGAFEIASADAAAYIGHGQTLLHFWDKDGNLKLVADGTDGRSIVIFDPPTSDGGAIGNPLTYQLVPAGWVVGFPGPHSDRKKVAFNAWDTSRTANPYYTRIFDLQSLLDGAVGDRSSEYISDTNIAPRADYYTTDGAPTIQGVAADANNVYIVQSTENTSDTAYLSAFSIAENKRLWRLPFTVGKTFAAAKGAGIRYEVEGLAWINNGAGVPKLWAGIRTRNNDNSGSDMYAMPLEELDIASASSARSPLQAGLWGGGQVYDLLVPSGEVWNVARYAGPDSAPVDCFQISGTLGRTYSLENHYIGTDQTLSQASSSAITGINILGSLGRISASGNTVLGTWQRTASDGNIQEFRRGTTSVGSISVTTTATAFNTSSDANLKDDKGELSYETALAILRLVTIHEFDWKASGAADIGVFAQELYEVYPNAVTVGRGWVIVDEETGVETPASEGDEGAVYMPWSVDYSKLIPVMFRVLQGLA